MGSSPAGPARSRWAYAFARADREWTRDAERKPSRRAKLGTTKTELIAEPSWARSLPKYRSGPLRRKRGDVAIGIATAALAIGGTAWLGEVFRQGPPKAKPHEELRVIQITMPNLDTDQEPMDVGQTSAPAMLAPPMQTDVPQVVTDTSFVQPLQPSPPENLRVNTGVVTIPAGYAGGFSKSMQVFDISALDQIPQPLFRPSPVYPYSMRKAGISGQVMVEFIVETTGTVSGAFAVSSTQRGFEQAAVEGVSRWRFRPGSKGGRTVRTRMEIPIIFDLASAND